MRCKLIIRTAEKNDDPKVVAKLINNELSKSGFYWIGVYVDEEDERKGEAEYAEWLKERGEEEPERNIILATGSVGSVLRQVKAKVPPGGEGSTPSGSTNVGPFMVSIAKRFATPGFNSQRLHHFNNHNRKDKKS